MSENKNFGKLIDQVLQYAPLNGKVGNTWYCPLKEPQLRELGYKIIEHTAYPLDGKEYKQSWKELKNKIKEVWTVISEPEQPTPAQKREFAYENELICEYGNGVYTVDHMNSLWSKYMAEGATEIADEIQIIIAEAKQEIREKYPDR